MNIRGVTLKISKLNDTGALKLLIKDTTPTFMNTIRRAVMSLVPTLSVENVAVYKNDSVLFDELLANRLALVPIKTDLKEYGEKDTLKLTLEKEGPCIVYSSDIESRDPKAEVAFKNIPITKLGENQVIKLEMTAILGTGKDHVKWQPALISYAQLPKIKEGKSIKKYSDIITKDSYEWTDNDIEKLKKDPNVELEYSNDFILTVESYGQLENKEVLMAAARKLKEKIKEFEEVVKEI
ncbi:MAG: DNA-directed RNA polymerase subunit D [Candidatus Diapherotrites archaeon CG08_land_8_20_14_0_20_34_12]|nr:MAG: DNA-directed RNA polymerase subunit D [Candidatus Diapherotrites archaeon CG08_land_8_20_14_0_20_34_12]